MSQLVDRLMQLFSMYRDFGPLLAIGLPFAESFVPMLSLSVIIVANVNAFGPIAGFLYSWLGAVLGATAMFFLVRRFGQIRFFQRIYEQPKAKQVLEWIQSHGFSAVFLLFCFPLTPVSLVNVAAGLAQVKPLAFISAAAIGKFIIVGLLSWAGNDIDKFLHQPWLIVIVGFVIVLFLAIGRYAERYMNAKTTRNEA